MRRPPHQKTSPRTLALPGFVVSGLSKMPGLMGSAVSFERVQMEPYWRSPLLDLPSGSFEASRSNGGTAQRSRSCTRLLDLQPAPTHAPHLNAFKWRPPEPMPSPRIVVERPIAIGVTTPTVSTSTDCGRSALPRDHAPRGLSCQPSALAWCRGMEPASGRQRIYQSIFTKTTAPTRLMIDSLGLRLLQITRAEAATAPEFALPSEPVRQLWNPNLPIVVEDLCLRRGLTSCATLRLLTRCPFASQSAVIVNHLLRPPIGLCRARFADPLRDAAASPISATALRTTTALDTASGSVEAHLQFILQGCACRAPNARGGKTWVARDAAWPRLSDSPGSSALNATSFIQSRHVSDAFLSTLVDEFCRPSSECLPRPHCARTAGGTCASRPANRDPSLSDPGRWQTKATPPATLMLTRGPGLRRPEHPSLSSPQGADARPRGHPFERVQMSSRSHQFSRPVAARQRPANLLATQRQEAPQCTA
jgi:hypothetical protein